MKKKLSLVILSLLLVVMLAGCGANGGAANSGQSAAQAPAQAPQVNLIVSAAASLQNSLTEIQKVYTEKNPNIKLTFNFAASGPLQQQIEQGAPADLFISAGKSQMDALENKNLIDKDTRVNLLGNDLVLVAGKDNTSITTVQDLTKPTVKQIAIGTPKTVPAGQYAQESLTNLKLWDTLQAKSKFVQASDVTQVLNYVETGNADAGFVYRSDAQSSDKVKVVVTVPDSAHSPIVYPAAVITASKNQQAAKDFLTYLESQDGQQIFVKYGFKSMK